MLTLLTPNHLQRTRIHATPDRKRKLLPDGESSISRWMMMTTNAQRWLEG